jgi:endoglucanase
MPNVLYEVYNEPLDVDWGTVVKPYHEVVVSAIRQIDPDNVIILGTPTWSQAVDDAAADPVAGTNLMYTLHFYSCTHTEWLRTTGSEAIAQGLPIFVTEWGATDADGGTDGLLCLEEAQAWHDWMNANDVSWTAWKFDGCDDSTCYFVDRDVSVDGGWTASDLNGHAPFVIDRMRD